MLAAKLGYPGGVEKLVRRSAADIREYAKSTAAKEASAHLSEHNRKHGAGPSEADLKAIPELTDEAIAALKPIA